MPRIKRAIIPPTDGALALQQTEAEIAAQHDEWAEQDGIPPYHPIPIYDPETGVYLGSVERAAFPAQLPANHPDPDATVAVVSGAAIHRGTGGINVRLSQNPFGLLTEGTTINAADWHVVFTDAERSVRMGTTARLVASTNTYRISNNVWQQWVTQTVINAPDTWYYPTAAQAQFTVGFAANYEAQGFAETDAEYKKRYKRAIAREKRIQQKALRLLEENLSAQQWEEYNKDKRFHVVSQSGKLYQIRHGRSRNIRLIENGKIVGIYCIHPQDMVPDEDTLLAQKLMLEANEEAFLKIANFERRDFDESVFHVVDHVVRPQLNEIVDQDRINELANSLLRDINHLPLAV